MRKIRGANNQQATVSLPEALAGGATQSLFCSLNDQLDKWAHEMLPPGQALVTVDDLITALKSCSKQLQGLFPGPSTVVTDMDHARGVILKLLAMNAPTMALPGIPDACDQVKEFEKKLAATAKSLAEINRDTKAKHLSFEQYLARLDETPYPELAKEMLGIGKANSPEIHTTAGVVNLRDCALNFQDLPSENEHVFNGILRSVEDLNDHLLRVTFFVAGDFKPEGGLIGVNAKCIATRMPANARYSLLLAQMTQTTVRVKCAIPRVPIRDLKAVNFEIDVSEMAFDQELQPTAKLLKDQLGLDF